MHKYASEYIFTAGVVLKGSDVRDFKHYDFEIRDAVVNIVDYEVFVENLILKSHGTLPQCRKLLLQSNERNRIMQLFSNKRNKGFVRRVFISDKNLIKLEIGIGKVRRKVEKKSVEKRATQKRELEKTLKELYI